MAENPILLVATHGADVKRRGPAPRSRKPPIVDTTPLKPRLAAALSSSIEKASISAREYGITTFPLQVRLRDEALAKSSRPAALFAAADVTIAAALGQGRLIGSATLSATSHLREEIQHPSKSDYEYEISTLDDVGFWEPATDAFGLGSLEASEAVVQAAARAHRLLKFELFPWLTLSSPWGDSTLNEFLSAAGFHPIHGFGDSQRFTAYVEVDRKASAASLVPAYGIRAVAVSPQYGFHPMRALSTTQRRETPVIPVPDVSATPIVGVLDSGVDSAPLEPWVVDRVIYDPDAIRNPSHGTFVAGLAIAPLILNDSDSRFPTDQSRVLDAQVMPNGPIDEPLLLERITEVVGKYGSSIRVWNCSFAAEVPIDQDEYSTFAQEMDSLARKHRVLFVQAAGNFVGSPMRSWPPATTPSRDDCIASPAEAVDSLTVASLSHLGGVTPVGAPASYSRRGPGFAGMPKPDVAHWSGDFSARGDVSATGVASLDVTGGLRSDVGTSFATPLVSTIAANVWADLESSAPRGAVVDPALVKGLVVHSGLMAECGVDRLLYGDFVGAGTPASSQTLLLSDDDVFTTVHAVDLTPGFVWWKRPFPVPQCLLGADGKFRGEVFMTLSYAPVIDAAFGAECVRTNVDAGFGTMRLNDKTGELTFASVLKRHSGSSGTEEDRIADGKWSPIKTFYGRFPHGKMGLEWALRMSLLERTAGSLKGAQRVYLTISLRGIEPGLPVYPDGVAALRSRGFAAAPLVNPSRLRVRPGATGV